MDRNGFKRNRTSFLRSGKIRFRIPSSRTKSNEQTESNFNRTYFKILRYLL
ncbi:hypothetical protein LEP1GSC068_1744 [Leptospira sp. Fiocruz LV3954]|nr:hypothetical protein LEP1GSC068_1744 [Leptospira sp. Fiocruz LV3954]EMI67232.1 hypothetical protein LEP1GSC076_1472 [Leptospira sp. Fiocruz LV4135]